MNFGSSSDKYPMKVYQPYGRVKRRSVSWTNSISSLLMWASWATVMATAERASASFCITRALTLSRKVSIFSSAVTKAARLASMSYRPVRGYGNHDL
jgi:hypothetical protein